MKEKAPLPTPPGLSLPIAWPAPTTRNPGIQSIHLSLILCTLLLCLFALSVGSKLCFCHDLHGLPTSSVRSLLPAPCFTLRCNHAQPIKAKLLQFSVNYGFVNCLGFIDGCRLAFSPPFPLPSLNETLFDVPCMAGSVSFSRPCSPQPEEKRKRSRRETIRCGVLIWCIYPLPAFRPWGKRNDTLWSE